MKTKLGYCYFNDGTVEEIQSYHQFSQDLVFFTKSGIFLFKNGDFRQDLEEEELRRMLGKFRKRFIPIIKSCFYFYRYRGRDLWWPVDFYGKIRNDRDEWLVADIKKIELYTGRSK